MTDAIFSGVILGLALVFSVGPVIFTIIKLRLNYGLASALYFICGVWLSDLLWVVSANFFSSYLTVLVAYKRGIGLAGGGFLIALGLYYLFIKKYHSKADLDSGVRIAGSTHFKLFVAGFLINTLNPGVIALWFAATTKTIANAYTNSERLATFTICLLLNMSADVLKINLAGRLRRKLTDRNVGIVNKISGTLFLVFGIILIVSVFLIAKDQT